METNRYRDMALIIRFFLIFAILVSGIAPTVAQVRLGALSQSTLQPPDPPPEEPPDEPTGLVLDLNAATLVGAEGASITSWPDASGEGNNATAVATAPKLYTWNGVKRLLFEISGNAMETEPFLDSSFNTAITVFIASEPYNGIGGLGSLGSHAGITLEAFEAGSAVEWIAYNLSGFRKISPSDTTSFRTIDVFRYNGTTFTSRRNGYENTYALTGNLGLSGAWRVGARIDNSAGFGGWIDRVRIYNRALTAQEIIDIETLMAFTLPDAGAHSNGVQDVNIVCDGNSLSVTGGPGTGYYPDQLDALLGAGYNVTTVAIGGQTTVPMSKNAKANVDALFNPLASRNILIAWEITNDLRVNAGGISALYAYQHFVDYCKGRQAFGWEVYVLTVLPRSEGGNVYAGFEADRQTVNTLLRANYLTFSSGLFDCAADARIGDAGDENDETYYEDKVHMTKPVGYQIIAEGLHDLILDQMNILAFPSQSGRRSYRRPTTRRRRTETDMISIDEDEYQQAA